MKVRQRFFPEPGEPILAWGYGRVSHKGQFDKGNSLEDQEVRIRQYFSLRKSDPHSTVANAIYAGMICEPKAQSAFSRSFASRIAGKELMEKLKPGHHLIVDKLDRIFRSLEDFVLQMRWFAERDISLHIVNFHGLAMDTGCLGGGMLLKIWAVFAESESLRISERIGMSRAARRMKGEHGGGMIPWFCTLEGGAEGKKRGCGGKLVIKPECLALRERLMEPKASMWQIASEKYKTRDKLERYYRKLSFLRDFFLAQKEAGMPDINTLKIVDFVREYRERRKRNG